MNAKTIAMVAAMVALGATRPTSANSARPLADAAPGITSFKDAAKIKSWDAWDDHKKKAAPKTILEKERRCVTMERLRSLQPGAGREIGALKTRTSPEISASGWSVDCCCLDRDYADWDAYKELLPMLGVKRARFISGWAKTEQARGVYDFAWLDPQLRECAAMGVKPWVTLAYGNPVWGSDFRLGMRIRQITDNREAFDAWLRYVAAVVARYADVVDEWEVWNEAFHGQGEAYATFFIETARVVKKIQPSAKVLCAAMDSADYEHLLGRLRDENALDLASLFVCHSYVTNPDSTYIDDEAGGSFYLSNKPLVLRALVKRYSPEFDVIEGESGCPAQLEFSHALHDFEWTEHSQAKWDLRRAIGDAVRNIPSSKFSMIDNQYTFMLQSFGLVRSNTLKEFVYRRPAWFAMRNVYSTFDGDARGVSAEREKVGDRELTVAKFERFGKTLTLFWFSDKVPSSDLAFEKIDLSRHLRGMKSPVWVEMVTGRVFELDSAAAVPVWDSPVMVCERGAVDFAEAAETPFKVDGRAFLWMPGSKPMVELAHIYPNDVAAGRDGKRWAEVTFAVEAPEAGEYEFPYINDYYGELYVNGRFVRETQGPWKSWAVISIPLEKGRNDVRFRTRSGSAGSWRVGFEIPPGLKAAEDGDGAGGGAAVSAKPPHQAISPRDPAEVWDLPRLKEAPKVREWPKEFKGGATPVMIEGEPYQGRDTWCFAYYGVPDWATPTNKAPGIVLVHGGAGTAYPEWVRMWVRRGYAAVCVDTCGALPIRTADGKWLANPEGGPRGWAASVKHADAPERDQWVYHAVAAAMRSHSFLRSLDCVDSRNVGVTGISWGGFLTCILAAADDRFAYAVPVYGCGFNYERPGWIKGFDSELMMRWARLWDASCYLPFAKCPMMWVDGTNDFAFSLDRVRRSAALAADVPHVFSTHLRMIHGHGEPGEGPKEILAFADKFARGGADVVRVGECRREGNRVVVPFEANGRGIARAELLYTKDGADVKWDKRRWEAIPAMVAAGGAQSSATAVAEAELPDGAFAWIVNVITDDGLVFSSPYADAINRVPPERRVEGNAPYHGRDKRDPPERRVEGNAPYRDAATPEARASRPRKLEARAFGAKGDGRTKDTAAIQSAIDACAAKGGGRVVLSAGTYLTAPIRLRSGVDLRIEEGAALLASTNIDDYAEWTDLKSIANPDALPRKSSVSLIFADAERDVSITGGGVIDASGYAFTRRKAGAGWEDWTGWEYYRPDHMTPGAKSVPRVVFIAGCTNVTVRGVTLKDPPAGWAYLFHGCEGVLVEDAAVKSDVGFPNSDGFHVNSCRNVVIRNCDCETGDDSIIVRANNRSLAENRVCENVVVSNCILRSWANAIRIGWANDGTIRNCVFRDICVRDSSSGIAIVLPAPFGTDYGREATRVENVLFEDVTMDGIYARPVIAAAGDPAKGALFGGMEDVVFRRVVSRGLEKPRIVRRPWAPLDGLRFEDCRFDVVGDDELPGWRRHGAASWDRKPGEE